MSREAFLSHLRSRLVGGVPENIPHPLLTIEDVPQVGYTVDLEDQTSAFVETASTAGAVVRPLSADEIETLVAEVVRTHGIRTAVLSKDPEAERVSSALRTSGVEILPLTSPQDAAEADLGVTGTAWALAATGTLVMDAGRAGIRCASLLPSVHLALVRADRVLRHQGELFRRMDHHLPDGPPSQLVMITGPSRSADIEMTLTVGVHGPKAVWIGVLD